MPDSLDYIDKPLESLKTNDPYLILEVAELIDTPETQIMLLDYVLDMQRELEDVPYLEGYARYLKAMLVDDEHTPAALEQAKTPLHNAISDPENGMFARAYLAYVHYELEEFDEALQQLDEIPEHYFSEIPSRQKWRDLEHQELTICCLIKLNRLDNLDGVLYEFFVEISQSHAVDVPIPARLSAAIVAATQHMK